MRHTHTFVEMSISRAAYKEIWEILARAGYHHLFHDGAIDMHGIAITSKEEPARPAPPSPPRGHVAISGVWFQSDHTGRRMGVWLEINGQWVQIASLKGDGQGVTSHIIEPSGILLSMQEGRVSVVS